MTIIYYFTYIAFIIGFVLGLKGQKSRLSCALQGVPIALWLASSIANNNVIISILYVIFLLFNIFEFWDIDIKENNDFQLSLDSFNEYEDEEDSEEKTNMILANSEKMVIKWSVNKENVRVFYEFTIPTDYFIKTMEITKDKIAKTIKEMKSDDAMWLCNKSIEDKVIIDKTVYTVYEKEKNND